MSVVLAAGVGVDLTPNARAPLAGWAPEIQRRAVFADRGRGPEAFDCLGIVLWVQELMARATTDYAEFYRDLNIRATGDVDALFRAESKAWANVEAGDVGDVLVLGHGGRAHHVAVLCGAGCALHISERIGARIDPIEGRARVRRFASMSVFGCVRPA